MKNKELPVQFIESGTIDMSKKLFFVFNPTSGK